MKFTGTSRHPIHSNDEAEQFVFCVLFTPLGVTVSSLCSVTPRDHFAGSQQPELPESSNAIGDMMSSPAMVQLLMGFKYLQIILKIWHYGRVST